MSGSPASAFSRRLVCASVAAMEAFFTSDIVTRSSGRLDAGKNCCCTKPKPNTEAPKAMSETAMVSQRCRMLNSSTCPKARMKRPGSPACAFMREGSTASPITGAKMTATNHDATSAKAMTANSEKQYCPVLLAQSRSAESRRW